MGSKTENVEHACAFEAKQCFMSSYNAPLNRWVVRVGRQIAAASFSGVLGCFVMLALGAGIGEMRNLVGFSALMIRPLAAAGLVMSHLLLVEVMPTIARGSALGLCYTVANVGRFGTLLTFEAMR